MLSATAAGKQRESSMICIPTGQKDAVPRSLRWVLAAIATALYVAGGGASCGPHTQPAQIITSTSSSA